jgi:FkbM family methyltransferase
MRLRNGLRKLGLTNLVSRFFYDSGAEDHFAQALQRAIRPGDVVWDVGANVGLYTGVFARLVGPEGKVFAFEPSCENVDLLKEACVSDCNVIINSFGLSSCQKRLAFLQGEDATGATSRIVNRSDALSTNAREATFLAGDDLIRSGEALTPNVIKIDVEGHELEVLRGLSMALDNPLLRDVFIEVHFALLDAAGSHDVPAIIENDLASRGFRVAWCDPSHIHASR